MLFNSSEYIFIFLPLTLLVYFLLSKQKNNSWAKIWLVSASLFFYGWWKPEYLVLITISIVVNYLVGRRILHSGSQRKAKILLIFGVIFNVGLLVYFKYANFIVNNFNWITGNGFGPFDIVLPLAISFFTFQQIAYLADCYGDHDKDYTLTDYFLFVTFFPQLIAGPIVHHKEMMPQFIKQRNLIFVSDNFAKGVFIFSLGLFKKIVIADTFAVWATAGFDSNAALTFFDAWAVSLSYTFQLYYDFSGYTDMAIGAALMFNIRLPINFNSPYKALNIREFWHRWHMTLSRWLRDYVYIPLGGSHCGKIRISVNLFLTFLIGGIWHGAGWTFIIWGAMHGVALVIHRIWSTTGMKMPIVLAWFSTFMFVNATWIFFRSQNVSDALRILKGMAGQNGFNISPNFMRALNSLYGVPENMFVVTDVMYVTDLMTLQYIILFGLIAFFAPNTMQMINHSLSYRGKLAYKKNAYVAFIAGCAAGVGALLLFTTTGSEFLYFNF